jgi:hypothetical protein
LMILKVECHIWSCQKFISDSILKYVEKLINYYL